MNYITLADYHRRVFRLDQVDKRGVISIDISLDIDKHGQAFVAPATLRVRDVSNLSPDEARRLAARLWYAAEAAEKERLVGYRVLC